MWEFKIFYIYIYIYNQIIDRKVYELEVTCGYANKYYMR